MNPNLIIPKKGNISFFSRRKASREDFNLGVNSTYILILLFIGFLGVYYVWILNINATKGYNIRKLEIQKKDLVIQKELLDVKIAELESLSYIVNSRQDMKKVENPDFFVIKDNINYVFNK